MSDYFYDRTDGKIHTRYTQLLRCTPKQVDRVLAEIAGQVTSVRRSDMDFGAIRHKMFEEEARETMRVPQTFGLDWPVSHVEHEFTTEILPGVVIHSRLDLVSSAKNAIIDYKTVVDGKQGWRKIVKSYQSESKQRQLKFYAFQLGMHGIQVRQGIFLCEVWNQARDTILRYERVEFPIKLQDIAGTLPWVKDRVALLLAVAEEQGISI